MYWLDAGNLVKLSFDNRTISVVAKVDPAWDFAEQAGRFLVVRPRTVYDLETQTARQLPENWEIVHVIRGIHAVLVCDSILRKAEFRDLTTLAPLVCPCRALFLTFHSSRSLQTNLPLTLFALRRFEDENWLALQPYKVFRSGALVSVRLEIQDIKWLKPETDLVLKTVFVYGGQRTWIGHETPTGACMLTCAFEQLNQCERRGHVCARVYDENTLVDETEKEEDGIIKRIRVFNPEEDVMEPWITLNV